MNIKSPYLRKLTERAFDQDIYTNYSDLPFYDKETDGFTDEVAQTIWLEQKVGIEGPTLTIPTELLSELIGKDAFRLILTRAAVTEIVSRHSAAFEAWFVEALDSMKKTGYGFTILNSYLSERVKEISKSEVDNYLRIGYTDIQKAVYAEVNSKLEATIKQTVDSQLKRMQERISKQLADAIK